MSNITEKLTLDRQAMKDRSTAHLRVYVGGLTDRATVEELYEHFIPFGEINGVIVNKNFGFVQFAQESSAQDAIKKADGSVFLGKSLNVRTAQQNTKPPEVLILNPEIPPAVVLNDNIAVVEDDGDNQYDSYGNYIGDSQNYEEDDHPVGRHEGRSLGRGPPLRGPRQLSHGRPRGGGFRDRSPVPEGRRGGGPWQDRPSYEPYGETYPRALPVPERNDCEIIVVSKTLTEYAEYIEGRLKMLGIVVDLLFPMEDVPIGKVLGNIASRGCLYAILVMPQNRDNRSLTLTILHGLPQEHRNMPLDDALQLISRNFQEVQRGGPTGREAVYALLGQLADGRSLTVLQYDKVLEYLKERREQQFKNEVGEPPASKQEEGLQQKIMSILNEKMPTSKPEPVPPPVQKTLLNDPSVKKALDSILQNLI